MSHCLYRHYDADGRLLYVGISHDSSIKRLAGHKSHSTWFPIIRRIDIEHFTSKKLAMEAERNAVITENPIYNIIRFSGSIQKEIQYFEIENIINTVKSEKRKITSSEMFKLKELFGQSLDEITRHTGMKYESVRSYFYGRRSCPYWFLDRLIDLKNTDFKNMQYWT